MRTARGLRSTSSPARELVQPATADLQRRHHRRDLLEVADEAQRIAATTSASGHRHRPPLEHRARRVERVGGDAERDGAPVGLGRLLQEPQQPGDATEPDEQHAGRVGVERARVADALLADTPCAASRRRRAT